MHGRCFEVHGTMHMMASTKCAWDNDLTFERASRSLAKTCFLIDFGVPLGSNMEAKIDKTSIIFQVGVPEGPMGRFWKDF